MSTNIGIRTFAALWGGRAKWSGFFVSAVIHSGILVILGASVFSARTPRILEVQAAFDSLQGGDLHTLELPEELSVALLQEGAQERRVFPLEFDALSPTIHMTRLDHRDSIERPPTQTRATTPERLSMAVGAATSVGEAIDRISGSIDARLQDGDLLVVWLLDASLSLAEERQEIAQQLEYYFQELQQQTRPQCDLLQSVVRFGARVEERVRPTSDSSRVLAAIRDLPIDPSGKEMVFTAVEHCVTAYRESWRDRQLMIVVWTDESGDDAERLADVIHACQSRAATVSVVGAPAVLGGQIGMQSYVDPVSRQTVQLPVTRGPDSALPERLELGYWFLTQAPQIPSQEEFRFGFRKLPTWYGHDTSDISGHSCVAATQSALPSWYGDADLVGLTSGFSPHALTLLALETDGCYVLLDKSDVAGPFRMDEMQGYQPDYHSVEAYLRDTESHALQRAVREAVQVTIGRDLGPPPMILFGRWSDVPPYGFMRQFFAPSAFARRYRVTRAELKSKADRTQRFVERALAKVGRDDPDIGLETEYEQEKSLRWRAWYDLTRGRLLATSVRLEEYRLACDRVSRPDYFNATTNHLIFVPSSELRSSARFQRRAAEAERLLVRCVRENAHTPWAYLAQRELDYELGIDATQHVLQRVVMPWTMTRPTGLPKF